MRALLIFAALLLVASALADGMYFAPRRVEARPTIPYQRAVLKFDGKEQIMLVESTLKGAEGTYGWVIPLPSKPSYLKPVNPTYITSSFEAVKPPIRPDGDRPVISLLLALCYAALVLTSGIRHRDRPIGTRIIYFMAEGLVPLVLALILWPVFAQSKAAASFASAGATDSAKEIRIEDFGNIGSYHVSVVSGEDGKPILNWLKERDLSVGEDALPVIEAYAKEGWCFMAAEVRKKERGNYPPHPIKAVFPSDKLVYPMRLTGVQSEPLRLELLVVSDKEASAPGMDKWASDNSPILVSVGINTEEERDIYAEWESGMYAMAKRGSSWTYLRGDLSPGQMSKDFEFDWKPLERYRAEVVTAQGAANRGMANFSLALVIASLVVGFVLVCGSSASSRFLAVGSAFAFLAAMGYAAFLHAGMHVVKVDDDGNYSMKD